MKKLLTLVALTAITGVYGQIDRSVRPAAAAAPTINIKNSEVFKLNNGITVILSENHKLPRVSFSLTMGASPMIEGSKAGTNNLMGELLTSGTTKRSKDVLDKEVDNMGASLNANGHSIYFSCLTKHLETGLDIMQDVAMNPAFPESEFERIKKQNESGLLSAKSDPSTMASNAETKIDFPNHPLGEVMDEASLAAITLDDVKNSYKKVFTPNGSYLVIVGDITKENALKLAEKYFGAWKGSPVYKEDFGNGLKAKGNRVIFVPKPGAVQSVISITFPIEMKPGADDQIALNVMNSILGGGSFGARIMQNLREDKAYTYGAYTSFEVTRDGSWFGTSGSFRNEVTDSAITEILNEITKISDSYVTDDELNLAKSAMAGGFARSLESPQTIARFALNIIRENLAADYYQTYLKKLESVSKDDVLTVAQKYFKGGFNIVVVGNEEILPKLKAFDSDGVIEKLDAFGNPVKEMKKADITADQLIERYINTVTATKSSKELTKKMKKVKSIVKKIELSSPQIPVVISMTDVFVAPNKEAMKIEAQGMVFQSSYYDGTKGSSMNMQTGKKPLTAEELASKKKGEGLFPEVNYKTSGMTYEIKGIETINGKDYYVLTTNNGESQSFDYFDVATNLKYKTISISKQGEETVESTIVYDDYKDVNGFLFAHKLTQTAGEMSLSGTVQTIEFNGEVDKTMFE
ncbi:insulinase family protein [Fluviicola taffensis]|uniref:Peptidase M16 domain protein n=1 Tax=Fluviicola taffensis (strain DSM 16823 / NCIMB 13979 / RW262) TaxID=755732 RepID=F2IIJ2_FLUTR|nr:insulinase family protein [Fluviicola taffensis]AEA45954.1 peptidase M16 domain protein [Fluviicola taffensis DSM 16823]